MNDQQAASPHIMYPEHEVNIVVYILASLLTCGIFNLYWNYRQMLACNDMVSRQEFSWLTWFLLTLVTCGFYHIYYQYQMGSVIVEIQRIQNRPTFDSLPVVSVLVTLFGASFVVDIIHQSEINKLTS